MNEQFTPKGARKPWAITDNGIVYDGTEYPYTQLEKILKATVAPSMLVPITNATVQVKNQIKPLMLCYGKDDRARAESAIEFAINTLKNMNMASKPGVVYSYDGARGRHIDVYEDRCCIITDVTLGSLFSGNVTDGEKEIYYADVISVQHKAPSVTLGYIQLETASAMMNNNKDNFFNENTFTYSEGQLTQEQASEVVQYIKSKVSAFKSARNAPVVAAPSSADELLKYKQLLDASVITQEEFEAKKKQLLGL